MTNCEQVGLYITALLIEVDLKLTLSRVKECITVLRAHVDESYVSNIKKKKGSSTVSKISIIPTQQCLRCVHICFHIKTPSSAFVGRYNILSEMLEPSIRMIEGDIEKFI